MVELTIKEFAAVERVTRRTVYNWIEKGAVDIRRTPGGRIRILDRRNDSRCVIFNVNTAETLGNSTE